MGQIVGAFCTSHVLMARTGAEDRADRVFDGMMEIRRRIDALDPDIVVLIGDDHFLNLNLSYEIPLAVPLMEELVPFGEAGLPRQPFRGSPEFSGGLVDYVNARGFDVSILRQYQLCHGFTIPAFISAPRKTRLIAPVIINTMMDPPPTPARAYELGARVADYIREARPASERVVVVGCGGLTHWVGVELQGQMNFDFDQRVFELFAAGRAAELAKMTADEILAVAGNGGLELENWIAVAGATGGRPGHKVYYEPMPEWFTGMAGLQIDL